MEPTSRPLPQHSPQHSYSSDRYAEHTGSSDRFDSIRPTKAEEHTHRLTSSYMLQQLHTRLLARKIKPVRNIISLGFYKLLSYVSKRARYRLAATLMHQQSLRSTQGKVEEIAASVNALLPYFKHDMDKDEVGQSFKALYQRLGGNTTSPQPLPTALFNTLNTPAFSMEQLETVDFPDHWLIVGKGATGKSTLIQAVRMVNPEENLDSIVKTHQSNKSEEVCTGDVEEGVIHLPQKEMTYQHTGVGNPFDNSGENQLESAVDKADQITFNLDLRGRLTKDDAENIATITKRLLATGRDIGAIRFVLTFASSAAIKASVDVSVDPDLEIKEKAASWHKALIMLFEKKCGIDKSEAERVVKNTAIAGFKDNHAYTHKEWVLDMFPKKTEETEQNSDEE